MNKLSSALFCLLFVFTLSQCGQPSGGSETETDTDTTQENAETQETPVAEEKKYSLIKVSSPEFAEASLSLDNVEDNAKLDAGAFTFNFTVQGYELGVQTSDAEGKQLANSAKGQHIHFILDNAPYSAHYEPKAEKELEEGGHVLLAFLSRSYHESVKNGNSAIIRTFTVGDAEPMAFDPDAKHLFYSRPKGDYVMQADDKLLLDFFLINTTLDADGDQVRATINGEEHLITEWAPYAIEGLEMGKVSIKLELIDAQGNLIEGPFNTVEREVSLEAAPEEEAEASN